MANTTTTRRTRGRPKGKASTHSSQNRSFGPLGDLIRNRRHQLGLGLSDIAQACDCSVQFVSNMEHGRAPLPWNKVDAVARILKIQNDQLQAANLTIRSDFRGFMGASRATHATRKGGAKLIKGQVLGAMHGAASVVALAAKDRQLQEVLERYQAATNEQRKRFIQSALELLPRA